MLTLDSKYVLAATLMFSSVITQPLQDDIRSVFGTTLLYHPLMVWIVLFCIIWVNTKSLEVAAATVVAYQVIKMIWQAYNPEPPKVARVRKILTEIHANSNLDDEDIDFIDKVTPDHVTFSRKSSNK